ncbi:hypothetical protein FORC47_3686 [Bacillus cereus]|nr:hypothetical protein FORC47_3686 [Bacillus cereus]
MIISYVFIFFYYKSTISIVGYWKRNKKRYILSLLTLIIFILLLMTYSLL